MVECKDFDERLLDYLYEELSAVERQACEQHLTGCARCQGELSSFGGVRRAARQLELVEPPAAVSAKLMYQAAQLAPRRRGRVLPFVRKVWQHPAYAMAACFLIVGGVTSWQIIVHGDLPMVTPVLQEKSAVKSDEGQAATGRTPAVAATAEAATAEAAKAEAGGAPARPAEEAVEQKPEPGFFDRKSPGKVISSPSISSPSKGLAEVSAKELAKGPTSKSSAAPKTALPQEGYRPTPSPADGDLSLDSIGGVSKKADKARSEAGDGLLLKNEQPATGGSGKASRGAVNAANDDEPALPEIRRSAPAQEVVQLPLGKDQNQQLARDTLPQPSETRSRAAKPSAAKPVDREPQVPNERNSVVQASTAPLREEAEAPAGAPAAAPPPVRLDNNLSQGQAPANRLAGNVGEDGACRDVELRIRSEGQGRVSAEDLWTDYQCLKRRGQAASARAQGDLRRLANEFPSFRSDEVLAERREGEGSDERNQRQFDGLESPPRAKKAKRAAPKQTESNKAY